MKRLGGWAGWAVLVAVAAGVPAWGQAQGIAPPPTPPAAPPPAGEARPAPATGDGVRAPLQRLGLAMAVPYARGKVPVVFIHGLWMNTSAWDRMIAECRADPALDAQFQFWTFGYATGDPMPWAASLLRRALDQARREHDPMRSDAAFDRMVLVGHSMGGLLAKMMVVESGDKLWGVISGRRLEELRGEHDDVALLTGLLAFVPVAEIRRVVFIATPHAGSRVDAGSIHLLGHRLARISEAAKASHRRLVASNEPGFFRPYFSKGIPSSVVELQANGPFLSALAALPVATGVRLHSIIAVREGMTTDGLVDVDSARVAGVESEKVVTSPHLLCLDHPDTIAEVRRILQAHRDGR